MSIRAKTHLIKEHERKCDDFLTAILLDFAKINQDRRRDTKHKMKGLEYS